MKVIFLDIDGVMNCQEEMLAMLEQNPKVHSRVDLPSPAKCKLLKQLVDETGAEIVLSSSWRCSLNGIQEVMDSLKPYNLSLVGVTPRCVSKSKFKDTIYENIKPRHCYYRNEFCRDEVEDRGAEIAYWLLKHSDVTNFVILDDESSDIIEWFPNNLVKTDLLNGLTEEKVLECIKILGGK
jgi:hypothetical protein